ncbi:MAG: FtsB family cell division protein [bacterium]
MKREILSFIKRWIIIIFFIILPVSYFSRKLFLLLNATYVEKVLQKNIIILSAENEVLKERINEYRKGTLIEARARDDLGMIKKGEKVYFLKP